MLKLNNNHYIMRIILLALILIVISFYCIGQQRGCDNSSVVIKHSTDSIPIAYDGHSTDYHDPFIKKDCTYRYTELGFACKNGELDKVKNLINKGACKERCLSDDYFEYDVMYTAVLFNRVEIVTFLAKNLLKEEENQIYNEDGMTLLTLTALSDDLHSAYKIADILVRTGADVNGSGDCGTDYILYPLFEAIKRNNMALVKYLVAHGVDINVTNKQGETIYSLINNDSRVRVEMREYINSLSKK